MHFIIYYVCFFCHPTIGVLFPYLKLYYKYILVSLYSFGILSIPRVLLQLLAGNENPTNLQRLLVLHLNILFTCFPYPRACTQYYIR